jgi:malate/lactate dehydrogenase
MYNPVHFGAGFGSGDTESHAIEMRQAMKLGIIGGAGLLGATTAFCVAERQLVDEIILYDLKENLAVSHAMDISIGVAECGGTTTLAGGFDNLIKCDIIINTAGVPERQAGSRAEYLNDNLGIYRDIAKRIKAWGTTPLIVSASNPIDVLNYVLFDETGFPPERLIGFSRNDTLRFKWSVAQETGLSASDIDAFVIGEHGDAQVPLFSSLRRKNGEAITLSDSQRENVLARIRNWFTDYQKLDCKRSSGWTSGISLSAVIQAIVTDSDEIISCSVIPNGEYGISGISIGLPVSLSRCGVKSIKRLELTEAEQVELRNAADKIREMTMVAMIKE